LNARISRNIIANGVGRGSSLLSNIVFVPLYLRLMGAESYGLVVAYATVIASLQVLDAGWTNLLSRQLALRMGQDEAASSGSPANLVRTIECVSWSMGILVGASCIVLAPLIAEKWFITKVLSVGEITDALRLIGLIIAIQWPSMAYQGAMIDLGRRLAGLLALSLDLEEDYFAEALAEPSCTVRLLHYPPQPPSARFNQLGCGAHTDWGLITLLLQDGAGGLEVMNTDGDWILAPPIPGTFVVNLGDMVPRMTNGLYHSTLHRVVNKASGADRYSVPTFFNPADHYSFDCVPTCRDLRDTPPPTVTLGDHVRQMFEKTYRKAA